MSRSGYHDDLDQWSLIRWRGAVASAIRGRRGQAFLTDLRDALDALPEKKLCYHDLQRKDGSCCALGAVGFARGIDMTEMDPEYVTYSGELSKMLDVADALIREIEFENDEGGGNWFPQLKYGDNGFPLMETNERGFRERLYETNDQGERVNANGMTKQDYEDRQDELRWSRMRKWVDSVIKNPPATEEDQPGGG